MKNTMWNKAKHQKITPCLSCKVWQHKTLFWRMYFFSDQPIPLWKIYSHLCWPHKRLDFLKTVLYVLDNRKSQMVLMDLKIWSRSKQWSKEFYLIIRHAPFFPVTKFITYNYLGSFVKATVGVRTEEITYILSKFMRTMFTEPLKNNRFSSSFVFGDQTIFWHFPFRD